MHSSGIRLPAHNSPAFGRMPCQVVPTLQRAVLTQQSEYNLSCSYPVSTACSSFCLPLSHCACKPLAPVLTPPPPPAPLTLSAAAAPQLQAAMAHTNIKAMLGPLAVHHLLCSCGCVQAHSSPRLLLPAHAASATARSQHTLAQTRGRRPHGGRGHRFGLWRGHLGHNSVSPAAGGAREAPRALEWCT